MLRSVSLCQKPVTALFGFGEHGRVFRRLSKFCHQRIELQVVISAKPARNRGFHQPGGEIVSHARVEGTGLAVFRFGIAIC